ncbi:MAG: class I SAM-dependent methyltransferase [Nitrospirae bacterium]|nr:class I SAM-dependent methyltransferase [Nitrospirota bacterium]
MYGVDYSQRMIEMNPVKKTSVMDACNLQFRDNSFDIVFCHGLLHHVEDMDKVIREMKRVSRKYVIILEPNRNNPIMFLYSALVKEERKTLKFSLSYLRKNVRRNGLHIMASFSHGMMVTNKLPVLLLPVLRFLQFRQPFGMTNFIIATKENY